jgi:hypothetical protein
MPRARAVMIATQGLSVLQRVREVPGSNLGRVTGYPGISRGLPTSLQGDVVVGTLTASFQILSSSSFVYPPAARHCVVVRMERGSSCVSMGLERSYVPPSYPINSRNIEQYCLL